LHRKQSVNELRDRSLLVKPPVLNDEMFLVDCCEWAIALFMKVGRGILNGVEVLSILILICR